LEHQAITQWRSNPDTTEGPAAASGGRGRGLTRLRFTGTGTAFRFWSPDRQLWHTRVRGFSLYGPGDLTNTASCGFQFGGVEANRSNNCSDGFVSEVLFSGFYAGVRCDDCTQWTFQFCFWEDCVVGIEGACNADIFRIESCSFGDQGIPQDVSCSISSGSKSVTGLTTTVTTSLKVGMYVSGPGIAADTKVDAVTATTVTLSANATATNAAAVLQFHLMTAIFWTGNDAAMAASVDRIAWTPAFNTTRGTQNTLVVESCWFMRLREALFIPSQGASQITLQHNYFERGYRIGAFGNSISTSVPAQITIRDNHFSMPSTYRNGAVFSVLSSGSNAPTIEMVGNRTDANDNTGSPKVPWLDCGPNYAAGGRVLWDRNKLPVDTTVVAGGPLKSSGFRGNEVQDLTCVRLGGSAPGGYNPAISLASGATLSWDQDGLDGAVLTLTGAAGNVTVNNYGSTAPAQGRRLTFILIQDVTAAAVKNVVFGNKYLAADGSALGTVTGGAAGTRAAITFVYDGANYRALQRGVLGLTPHLRTDFPRVASVVARRGKVTSSGGTLDQEAAIAPAGRALAQMARHSPATAPSHLLKPTFLHQRG
jgi:hypothetical protein